MNIPLPTMQRDLRSDLIRCLMGHSVDGSLTREGEKRKDVRSLYVSISDEDLVREIYRMRFALGQTET